MLAVYPLADFEGYSVRIPLPRLELPAQSHCCLDHKARGQLRPTMRLSHKRLTLVVLRILMRPWRSTSFTMTLAPSVFDFGTAAPASAR